MKPVPAHRRPFVRTLLWVVALLGCSTALQPARAQEGGDPPGRVARLSDVAGTVWLAGRDNADWIGAVRNQPLTSGDRLATDAGARAELQVGSTTLRIAAASELEVVALDDRRVELQLVAGSVSARVRTGEAARELSLETAEGRFRVEQPGRYRFDRAADGTSAATVVTGQAVYEGDRTALVVTAGQRAEFWIDGAGVAQYRLSDPVRDDVSAWFDERDGRDSSGATARYVSPEMTGAEDLDHYGAWDQDPDYGAIWIPRGVASTWAPYSQGRWSYVRPWGWTWVDDAPWGFAPFHYGRWVYARQRWCWVPGQRVARPVYAPALVAWVGGGRGIDPRFDGRGGPAVGWFPLAPNDVFVPSYHYSPRYVRDVNQGHVRDVRDIDRFVRLPPERRDFGNRRFPHALTAVPAGVLIGRQPVAPAALPLGALPLARELAGGSPAGLAFAAPPIGAPALPVRSVDARTRPPGFDRGMPGRPEAGRFDAARPDTGGTPRSGWTGSRDAYGGRSGDGGRSAPAAGVDPRLSAPALTAPRPGLAELRPDDRRQQPAPAVIARPVVPAQIEERRPLPGTVNEVRIQPRGDNNVGMRPDRDDRRYSPGLTETRPSRADERRPMGRAEAPAAMAPPPMAARPAAAPPRPEAAALPAPRAVEPPRAQPAPARPAEPPVRLRQDDRRQSPQQER